MVEHQLVRAVEQSARAERQVSATHDALERDHCPAQRAVDDGQLDPAEAVKGHLVPGEDPLRIRPRFAIQRDAEDDVIVRQIVGVRGRERRRVFERRNPVDRHAAPLDLVEPDAGGHSPRKEVGEARIDLAVPLPFEERVVRMGIVGLRPDPLLPGGEIPAERLTGLLLEESDEREELDDALAWRAQQPGEVPDHAGVRIAPLRTNLLECIPALRSRRPGFQEQPDVWMIVLRRGLGVGGCRRREHEARDRQRARR